MLFLVYKYSFPISHFVNFIYFSNKNAIKFSPKAKVIRFIYCLIWLNFSTPHKKQKSILTTKSNSCAHFCVSNKAKHLNHQSSHVCTVDKSKTNESNKRNREREIGKGERVGVMGK